MSNTQDHDQFRILKTMGFASQDGEHLVPVPVGGVNNGIPAAASATQALTASQSGLCLVCAVDAVLTLPAVDADMKGVWYKAKVGTVSAGTGLSLSPAAADGIGGAGLTAVIDKDLINTGATDLITDYVTIQCTGKSGTEAWKIVDVSGIWAKEA